MNTQEEVMEILENTRKHREETQKELLKFFLKAEILALIAAVCSIVIFLRGGMEFKIAIGRWLAIIIAVPSTGITVLALLGLLRTAKAIRKLK